MSMSGTTRKPFGSPTRSATAISSPALLWSGAGLGDINNRPSTSSL
jgi:hypothetical protein